MLDFGLKAVLNDCSKAELLQDLKELNINIDSWLNSVYKDECICGDVKLYNDLIAQKKYVKDLLNNLKLEGE